MNKNETLPTIVPIIETSYGNLYLRIIERDGIPIKIIGEMNKSGNEIHVMCKSISTLISLALKHGATIQEVWDKCQGIRGEKTFIGKHGKVHSIPDAFAKSIKIYQDYKKGVEP